MVSQDVHIIPLGWEYERAVKPFLLPPANPDSLNANRIHLIVPNRAGGKGFPEKVEAKLREEGFNVVAHDVSGRKPDGTSTEFQDVLQKTVELCHKEAIFGGHRVHINVSAGSKIGAFAAGLGGMAYAQTGKIHLYYVQPEEYTESIADGRRRVRAWNQYGMSRGVKKVHAILPIPIVELPRNQWQVLAFLLSNGGKATRKELLLHLIQYPAAGFGEYADLLPAEVATERGIAQTARARTRGLRGRPKGALRELQNLALAKVRRLTVPLERRKLVETQGSGSNVTARLTDEGVRFAWLAWDES